MVETPDVLKNGFKMIANQEKKVFVIEASKEIIEDRILKGIFERFAGSKIGVNYYNVGRNLILYTYDAGLFIELYDYIIEVAGDDPDEII